MEITIQRGGGLDGRTEKLGPVDTDGLPQETARQVGDIITKMDFFALPANITKPGGADVVEYLTTVVDHDRRQTVSWNDLSDTTYRQQLGDLIQLLEESGPKFAPYEAGPIVSHIVMGPERYDLTGDGVTIQYFPNAPLNKDMRLLGYSDGQGSRDFAPDDARRVDVADLDGTCISVTLAETDSGKTAATLLVPDVSFGGDETAWSFPVETLLITTNRGYHSYKVTKLVGEARR